MNHRKFSDGDPVIENEKIEARRVYKRDNAEAIQINLQPGGKIENHTTEEDVMFYVLEGSPTVEIDNYGSKAEKETIFECPGGTPKGISNQGPETAKILVIKFSRDR